MTEVRGLTMYIKNVNIRTIEGTITMDSSTSSPSIKVRLLAFFVHAYSHDSPFGKRALSYASEVRGGGAADVSVSTQEVMMNWAEQQHHQ
jgi:hypothetical protein